MLFSKLVCRLTISDTSTFFMISANSSCSQSYNSHLRWKLDEAWKIYENTLPYLCTLTQEVTNQV